MNEELRRRYVRDLIFDLEQVGGARLEQWIKPLWDNLAGREVNARGLNPQGAPVAGSLDAVWPDGSVAEASSDLSYFTAPYEKPRNDFRHVMLAAPHARIVRLFCTRPAGPKATTYAEIAKSRVAKRGYELDLWDGRRIAEYIIDHLLLDERFILRVGDALPNLRRICEQNAASARAPKLDSLYRGRTQDEDEILARLQDNKYVVLFGLGGIGKTEIACSIAHRLRDEYELLIWVDGEKLIDVESLHSFDVRLNGYKLNILDLLSKNKTLLILDNIGTDIDVDLLSSFSSESSRILITSQVEFGHQVIPIGFVDRERAREILSNETETGCPDDVLDAILTSVEGHPLVLRMLNEYAKSGKTWGEVKKQCMYIVAAPDAKRQTIASRILAKHLDVVGSELSVFAWCESASVDSDLLKYCIGDIGIDKLYRWALTARGQSDSVRLHDIVYKSISRIKAKITIDKNDLENKLKEHLSEISSPKRLQFFRLINRHKSLIVKLLTANCRPGAIKYAYLHCDQPTRLSIELIGDPLLDARSDPIDDPKTWLLSIVEAIEIDYRRVRDLTDKATAKRILEERLIIFDTLSIDNRLPSGIRSIAHHHKAKSLIKLGLIPEAIAAFELLLDDEVVQHQAKLQVARLIESDPERAKQLIFQIIESEKNNPGSVATSILLETLSTLRRKHLRQYVSEMTQQYGQFMAQQLKAMACMGEDQPIRAFAAIGVDWAYNNSNLFLEVLEVIDLGAPEDAEDDDERIAIGRILTAWGKMLLRKKNPNEASLCFKQAKKFFTSVRNLNPFARTQYADALIRLGEKEESARILDVVSEEKREIFWMLRRSETFFYSDEFQKALDLIDKALEFELQERRATFLSHKADILYAMGNPSYEACLLDAIKNSSNQYRGELEEKLAERIQ